MTPRLNLRSLAAAALALVLSGSPLHVGTRTAWATPATLENLETASRASVELSAYAARRAAVVSEISVSAPDTVRAAEGDSVYILATAASGSPYSIITIAVDGTPPNLTFSTNTPTAISPFAAVGGVLGYQTSGIWHLRWIASDQLGARDTSTTYLVVTDTPVGVLDARLFTTGGNDVIRLSSGKQSWCIQVEPIGGAFAVSDVVLSSLVLVDQRAYGTTPISPIAGKTEINVDRDHNGVPEVQACFAKEDLRELLAGLPSGKHAVPVSIRGTLTSGAVFSGDLLVEVVASTSHLAVSISPNPLNPDATLAFSTVNPGPITVSMFDLQGRLVRELWNERFAPAGNHRVRIDGRGRHGGRLASGVYVYRLVTGEAVESGRLVVLK